MIQIASEDRIALFQLARWTGTTIEDLMPPALRQILESPHIIKAGVNVGSDFTRLKKCLDIQGQGIFELSHLYKIVKYAHDSPNKVNRKPTTLAEQVLETLFLPLSKGPVRTSAWSQTLSSEQCQYAATDAYAGFRLFHALEQKRLLMNPRPPRPALYELRRPLLVSQGPAEAVLEQRLPEDLAPDDAVSEDVVQDDVTPDRIGSGETGLEEDLKSLSTQDVKKEKIEK